MADQVVTFSMDGEVAISPDSGNVLGSPEEIVQFVIDLFLQGSTLPKEA